MYEKRVHIRVPVGVEGSYQPTTRLAGPRLGMTRDISLGGARFVSPERLEPGGKISLTLSLPKEGEVILTGVVVWSRLMQQGRGQIGYESGLCWQNVDARAQARLNSFLTEYTRSDGAVIVSNMQPGFRISWTRVVTFGLGAAVAAGVVATVWVKILDLSSENQSLKNAVQSYQHQIDHISQHSR
ncbi:MAG: PilZ domain-containing protein [Candidatus Omnitrophota bacterium]|nr:PilZ domain-containing protein [Candidatus Omnitrophota bacterium]